MMDQVPTSDKVRDAIKALATPNGNAIARALNFLIPKTCEPEKDSIQIENYPELLINLGIVMDLINPLARIIVDPKSIEFKNFRLNEWMTPFNPYSNQIYQLVNKSIDSNSILLGVLCLIRNLSFEKSNDTYLAYSCTMMKHLLSLLLLSTDSLTECTRFVFDILLNISRKIDISASTRCRTTYYLEDCIEFKNSTSIRLSVSPDMSIETAHEYVVLTHQLLPVLLRFLQKTERNGLIRCLELCNRICGVKENAEYLLRCPNVFLEVLVDLLGASFTNIEPAAVSDADRPPPCLGPYSELIDAEVRNGAIDTLHAIATTAPAMRPRIAAVPHCMRILTRILCLSEKRSPELSQKLVPLILTICQHPDCHTKFLALQNTVLVALSSDDTVAEFFGAAYTTLFARNNESVVVDPGPDLASY